MAAYTSPTHSTFKAAGKTPEPPRPPYSPPGEGPGSRSRPVAAPDSALGKEEPGGGSSLSSRRQSRRGCLNLSPGSAAAAASLAGPDPALTPCPALPAPREPFAGAPPCAPCRAFIGLPPRAPHRTSLSLSRHRFYRLPGAAAARGEEMGPGSVPPCAPSSGSSAQPLACTRRAGLRAPRPGLREANQEGNQPKELTSLAAGSPVSQALLAN